MNHITPKIDNDYNDPKQIAEIPELTISKPKKTKLNKQHSQPVIIANKNVLEAGQTTAMLKVNDRYDVVLENLAKVDGSTTPS